MRTPYYIIILLSMLILSSCESTVSDFKIDQPSQSALLVYAFPSDADEYLVNVSVTKSVYNSLQALENVKVSCTTNGEPDEVTLLNVETHYGLPMAVFKAKGNHHSGDEIMVRVQCNALPSVEAKTTIPSATDIQVNDIRETTIDNTFYKVIKVAFHDRPSTDYYAFRVLSVYDDNSNIGDIYTGFGNPSNIYSDGSYIGLGYTHYNFYNINSALEPLLNNYVDLNLDTWDEYYQYMYIFNDEKITTPDVTMHLYAESCRENCKLQFFTLSREFYQLLDRLNSQKNNELGTSGLSQIYSNYNNVRGGFGCVAGYTCCEKDMAD